MKRILLLMVMIMAHVALFAHEPAIIPTPRHMSTCDGCFRMFQCLWHDFQALHAFQQVSYRASYASNRLAAARLEQPALHFQPGILPCAGAPEGYSGSPERL